MNTPHITAFVLPGAPRFYLCLTPSWHPPTDLTWVYLMLSSYPKYAPHPTLVLARLRLFLILQSVPTYLHFDVVRVQVVATPVSNE